MAGCPLCGQGINSTTLGLEKDLLKKVGYYCSVCAMPFSLDQNRIR